MNELESLRTVLANLANYTRTLLNECCKNPANCKPLLDAEAELEVRK